MSKKAISREAANVQNPALGAALIWRFSVGYSEASRTSDYPFFHLGFLVPPVIFHRQTFELLQKTQARSGIHQFADKFSQTANLSSDVLLGLHDRVAAMRQLTLHSIHIAISSRLVTIARQTGRIIPLSQTSAHGVPASIKPLLSNAEKFGGWCSDLTIFEVSNILKVGF
jgi:hypothetical protein